MRILSCLAVLLLTVSFALAAGTDIPKGTKIDVRMVNQLNSESATPGDQFEATLNRDLVVNGKTIAHEGDTARGRVDMADPSSSPGNAGGQNAGLLIIRLTEIETKDAIYNFTTNTFTRQGHGRTRPLRPSIADTIGGMGHPTNNPPDIDVGGNIGGGSGAAALIPPGTIVTFKTTSNAKTVSKTP